MYALPDQEVSEDFAKCWHAAAMHINACAGGELKFWIRTNLIPPMLEHFSFRLGNEIFFIRVEDVDHIVSGPSSRTGLLQIANGWKGQACLMPMKLCDGKWLAELPGWGLEDLRTRQLLHPPALISDKAIEMTDWELHDFAVQVVKNHLEQIGYTIIGSSGDPTMEPSIWFESDQGSEWVLVRAVRYPVKTATIPANIKDTEATIARVRTAKGHFASVVVVNADDPLDLAGQCVLPLFRGCPMHVRFEGLMPITHN